MSLISIINRYRSKHYCYLENDPNATDPPEYFIPGATSVPVIRNKHIPFRVIQPIDERREPITHIKIKQNPDNFLSLLFSNKIFSIDNYDYDYIMSLIDVGVEKFNYIGLLVHLTFRLEENGMYLLTTKSFLNNDFNPYMFENDIAAYLSIHYKNKSTLSNYFQNFFDGFAVEDYTIKDTYKNTIYLFEERIYLDVIVNSDLKDVLTPLVVAYDEFGILYTDYYYNLKLISTAILNSIDPFFNDKIIDFYYLTPEEVAALDMLLV